MQDEASTTYGAVIDQMTLGHQFLKQIFGPNITITKGWQIGTIKAKNYLILI
jgi:hypothetical protein